MKTDDGGRINPAEIMLHKHTAPLYIGWWALTQSEPSLSTAHAILCGALRPASPLAAWLLSKFSAVLFGLPRLAARVASLLLLPQLRASEITDGNVNFSFCVESADGKKVFIKQAQGFLKWQPQMALEVERMAREVQYFKEAAGVLGGEAAARFLPSVFYFGPSAWGPFFVMEYLDGHALLFNQLFERGVVAREAAEGLGEYMALVHARTLEGGGGTDDAARRKAAFWNPSLRAIQLEHVFTICFRECAKGRALAADAALMAEVERLAAKYLGYAEDEHDRGALLHGDFHPGSVMVAGAAVKVIDPEFTIYGPPGLDVGSLLSGFVLAYLYRRLPTAASDDDDAPKPSSGTPAKPMAARAGDLKTPTGRHDAAAGGSEVGLAAAIRALWTTYEATLKKEGVGAAAARRIGEDAVGFAMMEVLRTSLGFAGARDPSRRIGDAALLERYQGAAVAVGRDGILNRRAGGVPALLEKLAAVDLG